MSTTVPSPAGRTVAVVVVVGSARVDVVVALDAVVLVVLPGPTRVVDGVVGGRRRDATCKRPSALVAVTAGIVVDVDGFGSRSAGAGTDGSAAVVPGGRCDVDTSTGALAAHPANITSRAATRQITGRTAGVGPRPTS